MKPPEWLADLIDEYPTKRTDSAIRRLVRVFSDYDNDVMQAAVDVYLLNEKYFPKVGDLAPYVKQAAEDARGDISYSELEQQWRYTDSEMLVWEQERGTMPEDELLNTEYEVIA